MNLNEAIKKGFLFLKKNQKFAKQNNLDLLGDLPLLDIPTWLRKQMD